MQAQKQVLVQEIDRKHQLIATIDKTISHLGGKQIMKNEELYYGFDSNRQQEYEQYLVTEYGLEAEKHIKKPGVISEPRTGRKMIGRILKIQVMLFTRN